MKVAVTEVPSKRIFTHQEDQLSGGKKLAWSENFISQTLGF